MKRVLEGKLGELELGAKIKNLEILQLRQDILNYDHIHD